MKTNTHSNSLIANRVLIIGALLIALITVASPLAWSQSIAEDAESVKPLTVGQQVPSFTVQNTQGEPVVFKPNGLQKPVVLVSYRGGWCPYCNVQLQDLRKVLPQINALGVDVWFLSGDRPEILYSGLQDKTQEQIEGLHYQIYSDANIDAATKLGIAFNVTGLKMSMLKKRSFAKGSSMDNHNALPVPAVFVLDNKGIVRYRFLDPDYKVRLPADVVLQEAEKVAVAQTE